MQYYSLEDLLGFYAEKYPDGSTFLVARSLTYFDDADQDEEVVLFQPADWSDVKTTIANAVKKLFR